MLSPPSEAAICSFISRSGLSALLPSGSIGTRTIYTASQQKSAPSHLQTCIRPSRTAALCQEQTLGMFSLMAIYAPLQTLGWRSAGGRFTRDSHRQPEERF